MSDDEILNLFLHRCVVCWHPAQDINHIVLRSRSQSKIDDWKNKVPMCKTCHDLYHEDGVTQEKEDWLTTVRKEFLISIGESEYV